MQSDKRVVKNFRCDFRFLTNLIRIQTKGVILLDSNNISNNKSIKILRTCDYICLKFFAKTYPFICIPGCQRSTLRSARASRNEAALEFECPEDFGYYPHPRDCTQYYVCVFGGALLESCTGGLMYRYEMNKAKKNNSNSEISYRI